MSQTLGPWIRRLSRCNRVRRLRAGPALSAMPLYQVQGRGRGGHVSRVFGLRDAVEQEPVAAQGGLGRLDEPVLVLRRRFGERGARGGGMLDVALGVQREVARACGFGAEA